MESKAALKRFYKVVDVEELENGFSVTLDKRHLKSPAKRPLVVPTQALAKVLAAEWDAQEDYINASSMPMMALASTAVDRIGVMREGVIEQIIKYGETDLICYWTDDPDELAIRHAKAWTPYIDWAKENMGIELKTQTGVLHLPQNPETIEILTREVETFDDWHLSALSIATHVTGSIILGLALLKGHIDAEQAFEDSQVDETYQIELWGEDWEAADRRDAIRKDLKAITEWLSLIRS